MAGKFYEGREGGAMKKTSADHIVLPYIIGAMILLLYSFTDGNMLTVAMMSILLFIVTGAVAALLLVNFLLKTRPQCLSEWHLLWLAGGVVGLWLFLLAVGATKVENWVRAIWGFMGMKLYWIPACCLVLLLWHVVLVTKRRQPFFIHRWWLRGIAIILSLGVFISVPLTLWPLHIAYRISQPELHRVARELQAGKTFSGSIRVGLFVIEQVKLDENSKSACLYTSLDPAGKEGFSFGQGGCYVNLQTEVEFGGGWRYLVED